MSARQTIILTALPHGVADPVAGKTQLRLSVFITPRLKMPAAETDGGTTVLDKFVAFKNDWPQTLANLRFSVELEGATFDETNGVTRDAAAQSKVWKALFQPTTLVQPYDAASDDLSSRTTISYPVMNVLTFLKERYGNTGGKQASPTRCTPQILPRIEYPVVGRLFAPEWFGLITTESRNGAREELNKQLKTNRAYSAGQTPNPSLDFLQVADFHPTTPYTSTGPSIKPAEPVNVFDFHQMVSSLSEYPHVMRKLGLIVDLTIAVGSLPPTGRVAVRLSGPGLSEPPITPFTRYEFDGARRWFAAASKESPENSDFRNGLLSIDRDDIYGVVQVDVDGAALKTMNYVEQMLQASQHASADTPGKVPLPSLRSGGISLVRTNHAAELVKTFDRTAAYNQSAESGEQITLAAEDVISGYRVDVREVKADGSKSPWRSLCRRKGTYEFLNSPNPPAEIFEDEGMASVAAADAKEPDPNKPPKLKLSEMLFRWAGWSLTVPKDVCSEDVLYSHLDKEATNSFGFKASFNLPDTNGQNAKDKRLPRLRFGNKYQLRVRTVDLAGNGLAPEDPTEIATQQAVTYARFEPVSWPTVILPGPLTKPGTDEQGKNVNVAIPGKEGESMDRLVVRSQPNAKFDQVAPCERHIVPARIAQDLAETHGMFDDEEGAGLSKECFKLINQKNGTLPEVVSDAQIKLPYLPDPLALGVTFLGLPGNDVFQLSYRPKDTAWPDLKPFRLRVLGVPAQTLMVAPEFTVENDARFLTVRLPEAEIARVWVSTYLAEYGKKEIDKASELLKKNGPLLDKLGMYQWIDEWIIKHGTGSSDVDQWKHIVRLLILSGLHWLVTPYHEIVLVHAVKQPLQQPTLGLSAQKPGAPQFATFAQLTGAIHCHAKSTGKLDVLAEWKEPRDDVSEAMPHASPTQTPHPGMLDPIAGSAHVFEVPINLPDFPINQPDLIPKELVLEHGGKEIARVDVSQGAVTLTSTDLRHEFGDTKYRSVNYTAVATTRFREYFPPSSPKNPAERKIEQDNYARVSDAQTLHVLSSARPESPKVLYIIPAFHWEKTKFESKRHGGGLRVYMDRGWYSSGDGELLGVILDREAASSGPPKILGDADPLKPYVSQWGADPLRISAGTNGLLAPENFTNPAPAQSASGNFQTTELSLDELPNGPAVNVVPHTVAFDEVRRLWYCDIEINPGKSYFPFVRLALARYQPNSVPGVQLSRVVLADFVQLTPERTLSITPKQGNPPKVGITVTGPLFTKQLTLDVVVNAKNLMPTMWASLEQRDSESDLSWKPVPDASVLFDYDAALESWQGEITLPLNPGSKPLRLIVREVEKFVEKKEKPKLIFRTVYADVINLQ